MRYSQMEAGRSVDELHRSSRGASATGCILSRVGGLGVSLVSPVALALALRPSCSKPFAMKRIGLLLVLALGALLGGCSSVNHGISVPLIQLPLLFVEDGATSPVSAIDTPVHLPQG